MAHTTIQKVNAWSESTKLNQTALDPNLESQVSDMVLGQLGEQFDVSGWSDENSTPSIVQDAISMMYTGYYYLRTYSEDEPSSNYGTFLLQQANTLITGMLSGAITVPGTDPETIGTPAFYPNDASSSQCPTSDDPSLGPSHFSMGQVF